MVCKGSVPQVYLNKQDRGSRPGAAGAHTPTGKVWGLHFPRQAGSEVPAEGGMPVTPPERGQQAPSPTPCPRHVAWTIQPGAGQTDLNPHFL